MNLLKVVEPNLAGRRYALRISEMERLDMVSPDSILMRLKSTFIGEGGAPMCAVCPKAEIAREKHRTGQAYLN